MLLPKILVILRYDNMNKETIILCLKTIRKSELNEKRFEELMDNVFEDFQGISRQHIRDVKHNIAVICSLFPSDKRELVQDYVQDFLYETNYNEDYERFTELLIKELGK